MSEITGNYRLGQPLESVYHITSMFGERIRAEEAAAEVDHVKVLIRVQKTLEYLAVVKSINDVYANSEYSSEFKAAATFIILAGTFGKHLNVDSALDTLAEAEAILSDYEDSLSDFAERFPDLISYNSGTETISYSWNPGHLPLSEIDPPTYSPILPAPPATAEDLAAAGPKEIGSIAEQVKDALGGANGTYSPIVLDIDGSGTIELAALNGSGSIYWDVYGDDSPEASGWITGGDGLLCAPGVNGIVDGQSELFGNNATYANGYLMLAALYDTNSSNSITSADTNFGDLRVWVDANADGYSQSTELYTLSSLGITSISTAYSNMYYTISGNEVRQQSTFTMNGNSYTSVDVWFAHDKINTEYTGTYELDDRVLYMPELRGYGSLADLHVAMSVNEDLFDKVEEIASEEPEDIFAISFGLQDKIKSILFEWANVDSVSPTARGSNFDAQKLGVIESFVGEYLFNNSASIPNANTAAFLRQGWNVIVESTAARILAQMGVADQIISDGIYNSYLDKYDGTPSLNFTDLENYAATAFAGQSDIEQLFGWRTIFRIIDDSIGFSNVSGGDKTTLMGIVEDISGSTLLAYEFLIPDSDDLMVGTEFSESFSGNSSHNLIMDGAGTDSVYGNSGNDHFIAGAGADYYIGGDGNDTYYFSEGFVGTSGVNDYVTEYASGGTDTLHFYNIDPEDLRMWSDSNYTYASIAGDPNSILKMMHSMDGVTGSNINERIERITFDDDTVWDLTAGLIMTDTDDAHFQNGTSGNDILSGEGGNDSISGYSGNDTLYGGSGADGIYGGEGNDHIFGGVDNDTLIGGTGNDTYYFSAGFVGMSGYYDNITEYVSEGTDTIHFYGIDPEDLRMWSDSNYTYASIAGSSTSVLRIQHGMDGVTGSNIDERIERITFDDDTVWDLTSGLIMTDTDDAHGLYGTSGNDILNGEGGNDSIAGYSGNDTLYGGSGADGIYGDDGNDHLHGGSDGDTLSGGLGDDTYYFSAGEVGASGVYDRIIEYAASGTDSLRVQGVSVSNFRMWTDNSYTYFAIAGNTLDVMRIDHTISGTGTDVNGKIERIVFDDATVWDLTQGLSMIDTDDAHSLYGTSASDVLDGRGGNDYIYGYGGNDLIIGGDGNDIISGDAGTDTISYASASSAVTVNLNTTTAQNTVGAGTDTITGVENLVGSSYNDTLTGDGNANVIQGGAGNDTLDGAGGTDELSYASASSGVTVNLATATAQNTGGAGTDTISNFENLTGSAFNDVLTGNTAANTIDGGFGDDVIEGGTGNDILIGGAGTDRLTYISATAGVTVNLATLTAQNTVNAGTDTISGFENLTGSAYNDTLTGDGSDNVIEGGAGNDAINGAGGTDTLTYGSAGAAVTVNLATATAQNTVGAGTDTISNFENLTGSSFNDTLTGNTAANIIRGGAGNDTISGGDGNDTLEGGDGNDSLTGGNGTDTITYIGASAAVTVNLATATAQNTVGAGTDTIATVENLIGSTYNDTLTGSTAANVIEGGDGNDTISAGDGNDTLDGGAGDDTMTGGNGTDTVTYTNATSAVTVNLATATAQNTGGAGTDTLATIENLTGSIYNDTLTGNSSANTILGGDGNDVIEGAGGNDILTGGNGTDTVTYASAGSAITFNLSTTSGQNTVGAGTDTVSGFENVTGSAYNDTLTGNSSANLIKGGAGNDTISGGDGNDILYGEAGLDAMTGGLNADTFVFQAASAYSNIDTVSDFNIGQGDALNLTDLLGDYDPLTEAITDFVQMVTAGANTTVSVDRDGTGSTYGFSQIATLTGVTGLTDEAALVTSGNLIV